MPLQESASRSGASRCQIASADGRRCVLRLEHGTAHIWAKHEPVEMVPRSVAERLAEALERIARRHDADVAHHDHAQRLAAKRAIEYREAYPKPEEAER